MVGQTKANEDQRRPNEGQTKAKRRPNEGQRTLTRRLATNYRVLVMRVPRKRRASTRPKARGKEAILGRSKRAGTAAKAARKASKSHALIKKGARKGAARSGEIEKKGARKGAARSGKIERTSVTASARPRVGSRPSKDSGKKTTKGASNTTSGGSGPAKGRGALTGISPGNPGKVLPEPGVPITGGVRQGEGGESKRTVSSSVAAEGEGQGAESISREDISVGPGGGQGGSAGGVGEGVKAPLLPIPIASFTV